VKNKWIVIAAFLGLSIASLGSAVYQPVPVGLLTWQAADTAPGLAQTTPSSDVVTSNLTLTTQAPYASAATNITPGNFVENIPAPVGAGANGQYVYQYGGTTYAIFQPNSVGGNALYIFGGKAATNSTSGSVAYIQLSATGNVVLNSATAGGLATFAFNGASASTISATSLGVVGTLVHTSPQTVACGTGGTATVASSPTSGLIVTSGTLSSNCTIDFSTNATSGEFTLDMGGVTLGASFGVIFKNGTSSSATFLSGSVLTTGDTLAKVWTHGANTLAVQY
jgi:hypothetical protein